MFIGKDDKQQPSLMLGCDPEIFLQDAAGNLISAVERIGGTKEFPRPLEIGEGFAVQEDNVALEYNIPPADSEDDFIKKMNAVMSHLKQMVAQQQLYFSPASAAFFPPEQLAHYKAQEFGCDPDFNAWKRGERNPKPKSPDPTLRSCGGHVHVGHKFKTKKDVLAFIQRMDLFCGVPSVLVDEGQLRKQLYGKAGAFRFKPYGCEYRTLSNFWVFDEKYMRWIYRNTRKALESEQLDLQDVGENIVSAINNNNVEMARSIINQFNIPMPA